MARIDTTHDPEIVGPESPLPAKEPNASGEGIVLASEVLPAEIPILAVHPRPYFPGNPAPIEVRAEHVATVRYAVEQARQTIGLVLARDATAKEAPENLHRVGTVAKIVRAVQTDEDTAHAVVNCLERFTIVEARSTPTGLLARVTYHDEPRLSGHKELKAYAMAVVAALKELASLGPLQAEAIKLFLSRSSLDDPGRLADLAASLTTADGLELQEILETFDVRRRIDRALILLKKEVEVSKLQKEITRQIEESVSAHQREFFLREQLKAIKSELGLEKEGKTAEVERFRERIAQRRLGEEAARVVEDEMQKLELLEPASPEYTVTRNYLDWLTVLPWGIVSRDTFDVEGARRVLDRDHFGLDDVKERILEFVAVGKMKGDISGSILCLVGPPGVGKTSIGRSIAEAIGRQFFRFSLGGMRDEAEIKGHRRTYIGALPGKFLQAMKTVGTANPVIMLDEIDKIGASFQGDPAAALLEVLDPEQNATFRDHYLDVPFDLSHVLFIATANQLDTIPRPLLDRMEVIRLSGYIREEKVEIARRYLIPKTLKSHGLTASRVTIRKAALVRMIDGWAREAGVRALENLCKKIMRRAAMALARDPAATIAVGPADLERFLGKPVFTDEEIIASRPGVVTGLAWTSLGGATLQVEATAVPSKNHGFKQTGQLGEVMVESAHIAYSYVMARLADFGASPSFFDERFVHLHVPAGATPKDGPSAGITMATALVSMATGRAVRQHLAMTGELTLTGQVLPIGGVKEKVIAARRADLTRLILPDANRRDVDELPAYLTKGLEIRYASTFNDVLAAAFGNSKKGTPRFSGRAPRDRGSRRTAHPGSRSRPTT